MSEFADSAASALGVELASCRPGGGGDINRGWRIETAGGERLFAKSRPGGSVNEFADEAAGLEWLGETGALPLYPSYSPSPAGK